MNLKTLGRALNITSVLLWLLRYFSLGSAPFIQDEPLLQLMLDGHLKAGTWPTMGLLGTKGVHYGPTALWFYLPIRWLTDDVNWILAAHLSIMILGMLLLHWAIRRSTNAWTAALTTFFLSVSPYLFFYSRSAWDNTFLIFLTALLAFLVSFLDRTNPPAKIAQFAVFFSAGIACGLCVNSHLMSLPVVGAAILVFVRWIYRRDNRAFLLLTSLVGLIAVFLPYAMAAWNTPSFGSPAPPSSSPWDHLKAFLHSIPHLTRFFSFTGMNYFLDSPRAPLWVTILDPAGPLKIAALWALYRFFRKKDFLTGPALLQFAGFSVVFVLFFYLILAPDTSPPHYFISVFWMMFLFLSVALNELSGNVKKIFFGLFLLSSLVNLAFVARTAARLHSQKGTRGEHYGTFQSEIRQTASAICLAAQAQQKRLTRVDPSDTPGIFSFSVEYFFHHLPECQDVTSPAPADSSWRNTIVRFHYPPGEDDSARLEFDL